MQIGKLLLATVLALVFLETDSVAQSVPRLEFGKPLQLTLKGGETHAFALSMTAGQFIDATVEQRGINVVVVLIAPDGLEACQVDVQSGKRGVEPLSYVSTRGGEYRLEIRNSQSDARPGEYEIQVSPLRIANDDDKLAVAGLLKLIDASKFNPQSDKDLIAQGGREAAGVFGRITRPKQKAEGLVYVADLLRRSGQNANALTLFAEAGEIYLAAGMTREAAKYINEAANLAPTRADKDVMQLRSVALFESIGDYRLTVARILDLGIDSAMQGDYISSISKFKEGYEVARLRDAKPSMVASLSNLGQVYIYQNDYAKALNNLIRASEIVHPSVGPNLQGEILLNIGSLYQGIGEYELALSKFREALPLFEKVDDSAGAAYAISNAGEVYLEIGEYDKALEYLLKAQKLRARLITPDPPSLYNIASVYRSQARLPEARDQILKALTLCDKISDAECKTRALTELSRLDLASGDPHSALQNADRAADLAREKYYPARLADALAIKGEAGMRLSDPGAEAALRESIEVVEGVANTLVGGETTGAAFFDKVSTRYELLTELLIKSGRMAEALAVAERNKARALITTVSGGSRSLANEMSQSERDSEKAFRNELAELGSSISGESDPAGNAAIREKLKARREAFEDFRVRLYANHPSLQVRRGEMRPITLTETGSLIPDNKSAIVEFVVGESNTYLFVVSLDLKGEQFLRTFQLPIQRSELTAKINSFRAKIAVGELNFGKEARELYALLIEPAAAELANKSNLIIVPDRNLWALPFQVLRDKNQKYLIEKASISFAPSLTALKEMRKKAATRAPSVTSELVAFGNPVVEKETVRQVQRVFMSEKLDPIPEADRLLTALRQMYGSSRSKVYTGRAAKEQVAKLEAPKYRIVQFATHGILNNVSPMYSHLVLAHDPQNPSEDGLLEAWEIKEMNLQADMVILSACDTARGKISGGEGVIGMTWAAFIAGAPTTVASQWKVESSSTTEFMLEFHRQMLANKKISKAEALRRASLKLMKSVKYRHPSYWAPWILVGDGS